MTSGYEPFGKHRSDPIGTQLEKGRSRFPMQRKEGRDPGLTATEKTRKGQLMRQFMKNPEGSINSVAYKEASCWCDCGRGLRGESGLCVRCEAAFARGDLG